MTNEFLIPVALLFLFILIILVYVIPFVLVLTPNRPSEPSQSGKQFGIINILLSSGKYLANNKKLLIFPILSGVITVILIVSFIVPLIVTRILLIIPVPGPFLFYGLIFALYFALFFGVIFCNAALVSSVYMNMTGGTASIRQGLLNAMRHIFPIARWALISATIGLFLHLLAERGGFAGRVIGETMGGFWSLMTFFVVPIMVLEDKGVDDAMTESMTLLTKTWGKVIVGAGSISIFFFLCIAILFIFFIAVFGQDMASLGISSTIFVILIFILWIIMSALQGVFVTALYTFARTGMIPAAFDPVMVKNAFVPIKPAGGPQTGKGNI